MVFSKLMDGINPPSTRTPGEDTFITIFAAIAMGLAFFFVVSWGG